MFQTGANNSIITKLNNCDQFEYSALQFDGTNIFCEIIQNTTLSITRLDTLIRSSCVLKTRLIVQIFTQEQVIS